MPLIEAGTRLVPDTDICRCSSEEECREKCEYPIEPGIVYEISIKVDPPIENVNKLYDVVRYLQEKYPGIGINYVMISDDGREVVFQVFDPPQAPATLVPQVVWYIILVLSLALLTYMVTRMIEAGARAVRQLLPSGQPPKWAWTAIYLAILGIGIALVGYGVSKITGPIAALLRKR